MSGPVEAHGPPPSGEEDAPTVARVGRRQQAQLDVFAEIVGALLRRLEERTRAEDFVADKETVAMMLSAANALGKLVELERKVYGLGGEARGGDELGRILGELGLGQGGGEGGGPAGEGADG